MTAVAETYRWTAPGVLPPRHLSDAQTAEVLAHDLRDVAVLGEPAPLQPIVLRREAYAEMFAATKHLTRLLTTAVRQAGPDRSARLAALGVDDGEYPLFLTDERTELSYWDAMIRPDVVPGPDGPRFIEFNVSGAFGGPPEAHLLTLAWRRVYRGALAGIDPFGARAEFFAEVCARQGVPPAVAIVGSVRDLDGAETARTFDVEVEFLRRRGFDARFFEPEELPDGVGAPGALRYPVGLRAFAVADWRREGIDFATVRATLDAGCLLLPTQSGSLLANKKVLGWLSEGRPWMTAADRAVVERYVPWTRVLRPARTSWRGRDCDLARLAVEARTDLVLKKAIGMMGLDVLIGRDTDEATWRTAVEGALCRADSIVQEYVPVQAFPLAFATGSARVRPILSPMLLGGRPGGIWVRYLRPGSDGVVSVYGYGATENVALIPSGAVR